MKIQTVVVGPLETNCYIVSDSAGNAVIIDPGFEEWKIAEKLDGLSVNYIFLTHAHYDHFAAAKGLIQKTGAKTAIFKDDADSLADDTLSLICWNPSLASKKISADLFLSESDSLSVGELIFSFLHTPGHTKGSMCIVCGDALFTGDTLFKGDVGRTDLPGGSFQALMHSVQEKLKPLTKNYRIFPGHLEPSSLYEEKKFNRYMK